VKYGEIGVTVSDPLRGPKDYQVRDWGQTIWVKYVAYLTSKDSEI
jgi:hypothetical protein